MKRNGEDAKGAREYKSKTKAFFLQGKIDDFAQNTNVKERIYSTKNVTQFS